MNKLEIILLVIISIHLILSFFKFRKHQCFQLPIYLIGLDKPQKFIFLLFSLIILGVNGVSIRSFHDYYYKDLAGNRYTLTKNHFTIYDGNIKYSIKEDTVYLKDIKVAYMKYGTFYTMNGEPKLFEIDNYYRLTKPLYKYMFISNGEMLHRLKNNKHNKTIKYIEKENDKRTKQITLLSNERDTILSQLNKRIDSIHKVVNTNNTVIQLLKQKQ